MSDFDRDKFNHLGRPLLPDEFLRRMGFGQRLPTHLHVEQIGEGEAQVLSVSWLRVENPDDTGDLICRRMHTMVIHVPGVID